MLHFDDIVFGPIHSRRLGSSLGINLLPHDGKLCNFDCIYCECGWNRDGVVRHPVMPVAADVGKALESKLLQCREQGTHIDSITFSGNGEPTLNPDFPSIIDTVIALRDRLCPEARVSVLSNATMLGREEILLSLKKVDNPVLKLDAPTDAGVAAVNGPAGKYSIHEVIGHLKKFEGDFILQTMFLKSPVYDSSDPANLNAWMDAVRELGPREIMVYTLDRETPMKGLEKFTVDQMSGMVKPLVDEGYHVQIRG